MKNTFFSSFYCLLLILMISSSSCQISNAIPEDWNPSLYGPVAKVDLDLETISKELNKEVDIQIFPNVFGLSEIYAPIPPLYLPIVGPIRATSTDVIKSIEFESLDMTLHLTNSFPIDLFLPGAEIQVYNDNFEKIAVFPFPEGVKKNSSYDVSVKLRDILFHGNVNVFVTHVGTQGSLIPVRLSKETNIHAQGELYNTKIKSIQLNPNKEINITKVINLDKSNLFDNQVSGKIELNISNDFPIQIGLGLKAFDSDSTMILELIGEEFRKGIFENPEDKHQEKTIEVPISEYEIKLLKKAAYLEVSASLTSSLENTTISGNMDKISIQIISDLFYKQ